MDVPGQGARLSAQPRRRQSRIIEHPRAFAVALSLTILCASLFAATVVLTAIARVPRADAAWSDASLDVNQLIGILPLFAFALVGGLIAARRPRNAIGWILLASGLSWFVLFFADAYGTYGQRVNNELPPFADWLSLWSWVPALGLFATLLLQVFPDGHFVSRRWRPLAWISAVMIVILTPLAGLWPDEDEPVVYLGPKILGFLKALVLPSQPLIVVFLACIIASVVSLVVRYRRSGLDDREKLKWIAFAAAVSAGVYIVTVAVGTVFEDADGTTSGVVSVLQSLAFLNFALVPIAVGFAVLRYRLYDIDRLISRTLSYAVVTAILAGTYAVVVLGPLSVASSGGRPQWLVAVGTLAAAALFAPVRGRVQTFVDHRFDRRHYNASQTIDSFAARMRREIDLDGLGAELTEVVSRTMQPAHLSLWLPTRGSTARNVPGTAPR